MMTKGFVWIALLGLLLPLTAHAAVSGDRSQRFGDWELACVLTKAAPLTQKPEPQKREPEKPEPQQPPPPTEAATPPEAAPPAATTAQTVPAAQPVAAASAPADSGAEPTPATAPVAAAAAATCAMIQQQLGPDGKRPVFIFQILPGKDKQPAKGLISLPLGVYLGAGITMQIDKQKPFRLPYHSCNTALCSVEFWVQGPLLAAFQRGAKARVVVQVQPTQAAAVEVSLKGFTAAFKQLHSLP